jgi:hypothetical protein
MVAAALGGEFEVPTIEKGKTKVKVPAGTQSGRRFRIASKGMPVLRSRQTGDMYVQVMVETPQNLTKKQQELLAEFEKLSSGATQPEAAGFFTKVKDFFGNRAGWPARMRAARSALLAPQSWFIQLAQCLIAASRALRRDRRVTVWLDHIAVDLYVFMTVFWHSPLC